MNEWLYEFLYRGRSDNSGAWHVIMMDQNGKQTVLNMTQAEEKGYGLPAIIADINTELMQEIEALRLENENLKAQLSNPPT